MTKMIGQMGRNAQLMVLLLAAIVSPLFSCGHIDVTTRSDIFSISGQVTSGGAGLAGVTVTLSGSAQGTAISDAFGNYTVNGLVNGTYTLTPTFTGFIFTPSSIAQTIDGVSITAVNFIATPNDLPTFTLSGTVTSAGSGLANIVMTLSGTSVGTVTTNAVGNYLFAGLVSGNYTVTPALLGITFNPLSSAQLVSNANIAGVDFTTAAATTVQLVDCPLSPATNVTIQDFSYASSSIIVGVNSIVKWTNNGPADHTVMSGTSPNLDGKFNSGTMLPSVTVCYQFLATGTYPYFCTIHPEMTGSVLVQ